MQRESTDTGKKRGSHTIILRELGEFDPASPPMLLPPSPRPSTQPRLLWLDTGYLQSKHELAKV